MTSALAAELEDAPALRRRLATLEAETARLRLALGEKRIDLETVAEPVLPGGHGLHSPALVHGLLEAISASIKILDADGRLVFANARGIAAVGAEPGAMLIGRSWPLLWPPDQAPMVRTALQNAQAGRIARFEAPRPDPSGQLRWWDVAVVPLAGPGGFMLAVLHDVSDRVEALREKDALLREKDLLMQEVHHRVKNSVQMVQNLLKLQARSCVDKVAAAQLADSAARVHMIGAIHDRLYRSGGTLDVDVRSYLEELVRDLRISMGSALLGRDIVIQADAASWPAVEVPPLGLVMTELVTNALKYGAGTVRVEFRRASAYAQLIVEDDGPGLPADFDLEGGQGLGMRLVRAMLRRPGASLTLDRQSPKTRFVVLIPHADHEAEDPLPHDPPNSRKVKVQYPEG